MDRFIGSRVCRMRDGLQTAVEGSLPRGSRTPAPRRRNAFSIRCQMGVCLWPKGGLEKENGTKRVPCRLLGSWGPGLGVTFISPGATSRQPPHASATVPPVWLACGSGRVSSLLPHPASAGDSSGLGPGPVASAPWCIAKWFWTRNEMGLGVRTRGREGASCSKSVRFNLSRIASKLIARAELERTRHATCSSRASSIRIRIFLAIRRETH